MLTFRVKQREGTSLVCAAQTEETTFKSFKWRACVRYF